MAFIETHNVAIKGFSACVPKNVEENKDLPFYAPGEAEPIMAATGIERRHVAPDGMTAADLCTKAAEGLIKDLGWEKDSIDLLAFVTQNPDYLNQPNSFVCHDMLDLGENTMCIDYFHGCPGWVIALSSVLSMMQNGRLKRVLLMAGDTASKEQAANNREERPLFGDAGTVTALEFVEGAPSIKFNIGTNSKDGRAITHQQGGARNPFTLETLKNALDRRAGKLNLEEDGEKMDAMDVFGFAITKAPKSIKKLCGEFEINVEDIDKLVLHQANKLIMSNIAKRLKVPMEKVPLCLKNFGNTTSASIPLAILSECAEDMRTKSQKILACGYGTGLAWGAVYFETNKIVCSNIQYL